MGGKRSAAVLALMLYATASNNLDILPEIRNQHSILSWRHQHRDLYDLEHISSVDLSRKKVTIAYTVQDHEAVIPFRKHEQEIFRGVVSFYSQYGVDVRFKEHATNATFFLEVKGRYHSPAEKNELVISYPTGESFAKEGRMDLTITKDDNDWSDKEMCDYIANTIAHELGHLCSLYHPSNVPDGIVHDWNNDIPNLMWPDWARCTTTPCYDLLPTQVVQMHSFLSKGQAYEALKESATFNTYVENVADAVHRRH